MDFEDQCLAVQSEFQANLDLPDIGNLIFTEDDVKASEQQRRYRTTISTVPAEADDVKSNVLMSKCVEYYTKPWTVIRRENEEFAHEAPRSVDSFPKHDGDHEMDVYEIDQLHLHRRKSTLSRASRQVDLPRGILQDGLLYVHRDRSASMPIKGGRKNSLSDSVAPPISKWKRYGVELKFDTTVNAEKLVIVITQEVKKKTITETIDVSSYISAEIEDASRGSDASRTFKVKVNEEVLYCACNSTSEASEWIEMLKRQLLVYQTQMSGGIVEAPSLDSAKR